MIAHVRQAAMCGVIAIVCALPLTAGAQDKPSLNRAYPAVAMGMCIPGWVDLDYLVGEDGHVSDVRVIRSDPPGMFDRVAKSTYELFEFTPAVHNGKPVAERRQQRVEYALLGGC